jgi:diguanylate cyclase
MPRVNWVKGGQMSRNSRMQSVLRSAGQSALFRREMAAFLPALALATTWYGLRGAALVSTTALAVAWLSRPHQGALPAKNAGPERDGVTALPLRAEAENRLEQVIAYCGTTGKSTACLVIGLDAPQSITARHGATALNECLCRTGERIAGALREGDYIARLDGARFAIVLAPVPRADLESIIQIATRLQTAVEVPFSIGLGTVMTTAHVGFCLLTRTPERNGVAMLGAAEMAAALAAQQAPSGLRAYSVETMAGTRATPPSDTDAEVMDALEGGQIVAHFTPQLSTDTGEVAGFSATPRWLHPVRGLLPETDFLPAITRQGLDQRLTEVMLYHVFSALRSWARSGMRAGPLTLKLPAETLLNPKMVEKLRWEFDRFEMEPAQLCFSVAGEMMSDTGRDVVLHNLSSLARMGAGIEVTGFGLGAIPIATLRGCGITRLRLDQNFSQRVDTNSDQQKLTAAILSMAERLGLETVAEGVGSIGEHAMLAQLGCGLVEGTAISRPLPYEDAADWVQRHHAKLKAPPHLGKRRN